MRYVIHRLLFNDVLDDYIYALVDTSDLKRTKDDENKPKVLAPKEVCAVPDFVITKSDFDYEKDKNDASKILGCIEVKYFDKDIIVDEKLEKRIVKKKSYSEVYHNVLYTNGWIWKFYKAGNINIKKPNWNADFREFRNASSLKKLNKEYGKLLNNLCSINWSRKK